jgi:hypothetical protein
VSIDKAMDDSKSHRHQARWDISDESKAALLKTLVKNLRKHTA